MKDGFPSFTEKDLSPDEAIRQKLLRSGAASLTEAELISILIQEGKNEPAIELSRKLLKHYRNLTQLSVTKIDQLRMFRGIGVGRTALISAALELGKRRKAEDALLIQSIQNKEDVVELFKPLISDLPHEEFWAVYLGPSHRILDKIKIGQGNATSTIIDNRKVIFRAIEKWATSLIVVHNHPSGQPQPSPADVEITRRLKEAAALFDIRLTDHIIITVGECFSFLGHGLL
ncbi:MAG: DNA repair protein RadC [Rikenellaceae bacterium]|nr:DNA repair protein RadC [Rikenellaceae bacterium]